MELQNVKDIGKQISELIEENEKLKYVKNRNVEVVEKMNNIIQQLKDLIVILNPIVAKREYKTGQNHGKLKPIVTEFYEKIQAGTHVTRKLIESTYTDLAEKQVHYILLTLSRMPHVGKARDGMYVRLFQTNL